MKKDYDYIDPRLLERAPEHTEMFTYKTIEEFEDLKESYAKYDRCHPIYYEQREIDGKLVNAIIDGEKYHLFAIEIGMEKVFACKIAFENEEDRITLMAQLQRSYHDNYMALYNMIQGLWPKHFRGQGYRSDITEIELDKATDSIDGKRLNIYDRIGKELFLSGNKVKQIRKVGMVNKLFFERIEAEKYSLFQAYHECVKEEKGEMPAVPSVKAPVYHTTSTSIPVFSEPTTTAYEDNLPKETIAVNNVSNSKVESSKPDEEFVTVTSTCPHCGKEITLRINKNQIK